MSYSDTFFRDLRLAILRCLVEMPQEPVSDSIVFKHLKATRNPATRDQFDGQLVWLRDEGLVRLAPIPHTDMNEIELLFSGELIARGQREHPHIDTPSRRRI